MIQWTGAPTTDATTVEEIVTVTSTLIEGIDWQDDEQPYLTFMDGWRFRFDYWHMHAWYGDRTSLVPHAERPRRIEEAGNARRWTSGFK